MKSHNLVAQWIEDCSEMLKKLHGDESLSKITFNVDSSVSFLGSKFQGRDHSKGPISKTHSFNWSLLICLPATGSDQLKAVEIKGTGAIAPSLLKTRIEKSLRLAQVSKYTLGSSVLHDYPKLSFSDPKLLKTFENETEGYAVVSELLHSLSLSLQEFKHSKLMGHECHVSLSQSDEGYWDTLGNFALQSRCSVDLGVGISLSDFSDFSSESYGHVPSEQQIERFFVNATRHLTETPLQPLSNASDMKVVLLPQAFLSLLGDLLFPNFRARSLLKGESKFSLGELQKAVCSRLTVRDSPHEPGSPFSQVFDFEGRPTIPCDLLKNGFFVQPMLTSSQLAEVQMLNPDLQGEPLKLSGHASGLDSTSFTNMYVELEEVPQSPVPYESAYPCVAVIHNLTGMSANPLTGDFALDAEGARIFLNGKLCYTSNFTISGCLYDLLEDPDLVQIPSERIYNTTAPGILTKKLNCVSKGLELEVEK
jgi:PmbA/TldA metallopeptidase C-terminal domain